MFKLVFHPTVHVWNVLDVQCMYNFGYYSDSMQSTCNNLVAEYSCVGCGWIFDDNLTLPNR